MGQDDELIISSKAFANRLLTACGLTHKERVQVFINAGFRYEPRVIEEVLRLMYPHIGDQDRRMGKAPDASDTRPSTQH
eukprot:7414315-Heterocapsa_arctica.AAC.1